jgi:hypothetical protein
VTRDRRRVTLCGVPDTRSHRGPHPEDGPLFCPAMLPRLWAAVADLSWLLTRGYALPGALQVVGNRYELTERQRKAITRSACPDGALKRRLASEASESACHDFPLLLDGYNVLTTVEAALGGGVVLHGRDGAYRDLASVHGTWRRVEETLPAVTLIGRALAEELNVSRCTWYLDAPVCNSGRLKAILEAEARRNAWEWTVLLVPNPDKELSAAPGTIVATADAGILDACERWFALSRHIVQRHVPAARVIDLCVRRTESPGETA